MHHMRYSLKHAGHEVIHAFKEQFGPVQDWLSGEKSDWSEKIP